MSIYHMFKMRMKNVLAVAFVLASMVISCASQDQNRPYTIAPASGAIAVLRQVAETYKNLKSYHFEGRYAWEQATESMGLIDETKSEESFVSASIKPDRLRIESKNANFGVALVYDGKTKWVYASGGNEYMKTEVAPAKSATRLPAVDPRVYLARAANLLVMYTSVADGVREAKIAGEETLEIGGRRVDCLVIEVYYLRLSTVSEPIPPTRKLWIDKSRNVVLRENQRIEVKTPQGKTVTTKATYIFTTARLGEQVPETLFTFVPPEGAKEVTELTPLPEHAVPPHPAAPARANLAGKDAIAFSLKDMNGNQVDLQTLKGKVALLDFWSSWCGPCVRELPHIEKLHRDFKDRGLVTLGVNDEEADVARAFLKKNGYTFTNLVDEGREVSMKYRVSGVPQVLIIGREGKIKWHAIGYGPGREAQLRNAVEMVLKGIDPPAPVSPSSVAPVTPEEKVREGMDPPAPKMIRLSTGVLSGSATKKAQPNYPTEAKAARAEGPVQVEITVSESGKVIEAKAISGHEMLRDAAVQAAKQWEFKPAEVSGAPVKMQGILVFDFALQ